MNPEVKAKWLKALRSGRYKQTKHALKKEDGYCCLGVLTNIYIKETKNGSWKKDEGDTMFKMFNKQGEGVGEGGVLTKEVMDWAGIPKLMGTTVVPNGSYRSLASENDLQGKSFKKIADIIETNL